MIVERNSAFREGWFALSKLGDPRPLPPHEVVSRSISMTEKGRVLLAKKGVLVAHNGAERGMYSAFETPRVRVEVDEKDSYEVWLESGSKDARSFRMIAERNGTEYVLYRFKKNKVKDGGRHAVKTGPQFENLEEHMRVLHALH